MALRRSLFGIALATSLVGCSLFASLDGLQGDAGADAGSPSDASKTDASSMSDSGSNDAATIDASLPPIVFVQSATATLTSGNTSSLSATFSKPVVAGDTLILFTSWGNNTGFASVSDTGGNTFTLLGSVARSNNPSQMLSQALYVAVDVKDSDNDVINVNYGGSYSTPDIRTAEYSGLSTTAPYSGQMAASFGSDDAPVTALNVTLTGRYLVVAGGSAWTDFTGDAPSGFSVRIMNDDQGFFADQFTSGPESLDAGFPLTGTGSWLVILAAFQ